MRKIIVHLMTGYCGEDCHEALSVPDDYPDYRIDSDCWDMAVEHAEGYGHYIDDDDDEADYTSDEVDYHWWDYKPEDDDQYRCGGGSFEDDFE